MDKVMGEEIYPLRPSHHIGGFLKSPGYYSSYSLKLLKDSKKVFLKSSGWYFLLIGLIVSAAFTYFVFYPEVYLIPHSIKGGLSLFIFMLSDPLMIGGAFLGGLLLVFGFDFSFQGSISYLIIRSVVKKKDADGQGFDLSLKNYLKMYGYGGSYTMFFSFTLILWIYFFERFSFAKTFFPVANVTIPFLIQVISFAGCIVGKWIFEFRINRSVLKFYGSSSNLKVFLVTIYKFVVLTTFLVLAIFGSNTIAAQYS